LEAGVSSIDQLYNKILECLGVKGLYWLDDWEANEIDLEENRTRLVYTGGGENLRVDRLDFATDCSVKTLTAESTIYRENVTKEALSKLRRLVKNVQPTEEFGEPETFTIEIDEVDSDTYCLRINLTTEHFEDFPSVVKMSELVEQIFEKAGTE